MTALEYLCANLTDDPGQDMGSHLLVLYSLARFLPGRRVVEIGVDDGSSTIPLTLGAAFAHGHCDSVDIAPCPKAESLVDSLSLRQWWTFHQMRSVEYAAQCAPDSLDLVLIDGDHSFAGVSADWEAFAPLVRVGGLILFHDKLNVADFPGIAHLIDWQIRPEWKRWEACTLPWGWGLTICRRLA